MERMASTIQIVECDACLGCFIISLNSEDILTGPYFWTDPQRAAVSGVEAILSTSAGVY